METVDCSPLLSGLVTHETVPLVLHYESNHRQANSFQLITSPKVHVITGIPWFYTDIPSINWED